MKQSTDHNFRLNNDIPATIRVDKQFKEDSYVSLGDNDIVLSVDEALELATEIIIYFEEKDWDA